MKPIEEDINALMFGQSRVDLRRGEDNDEEERGVDAQKQEG